MFPTSLARLSIPFFLVALHVTAAGPDMGRRVVLRETVLAGDGSEGCRIVCQQDNPFHHAQAERLRQAISGLCGHQPVILSDTSCVKEGTRYQLRNEFRSVPLILLGNINTNRLLVEPYTRYACAADANYPGAHGYVLRTLSNPWGGGVDQILIGASTDAGLRRGVDAFLKHLPEQAEPGGELRIPYLLEVVTDPEWARQLSPPTDESCPEGRPSDLVKRFAHCALRYRWSGDLGWARKARNCLLALLAAHPEHLPDLHYLFTELVRGWDMVDDSGVFSAEEITAVDRCLLGTLIANQDAWWRKAGYRQLVGSRHHTAGTASFLRMARFLLRCGTANAAARDLLRTWEEECRQYMHSVGEHFHNPNDSETAADAIEDTYWFSLENGDMDFFDSGNARRTAAYCVMCWDNIGFAAGICGYQASYPACLRMGERSGLPLAVNAFVYGDGGSKRLLQALPRISYAPYFMPHVTGIHEYATGPELPSAEPENFLGVRKLEIVRPWFEAISGDHPHTPTRGVGGNLLPYDETFNKITFRDGFDPDDSYLLLQGFQAPSDGTVDANCIVRYTEAGHIFLFHNVSKTGGRTQYFKNGVHVGRGEQTQPLPACASLDVQADLPGWGCTASTLPDCHGSDWQRSIFWRKGRYHVVLDRVCFTEPGPASVTCTWRTPQHAAWDGEKWSTTQAGDTFVLRPAGQADIRARRENLLMYGSQSGAASPWVLREKKHLDSRPGQEIGFANAFYVVREGQSDGRQFRRLSPCLALLREDDGVTAFHTPGPDGQRPSLPFQTDAAMVAAGPDTVALAGATYLSAGGMGIASAASRFDAELDLAANLVVTRSRGDVTVLGKPARDGEAIPISAELAGTLAATLRQELTRLWQSAPESQFHAVTARPPAPLTERWSFDALRRSPRALPVAQVSASGPGYTDVPEETVVDTLLPSSYVAMYPLADPPGFECRLASPHRIAEARLLTYRAIPHLSADVACGGRTFPGIEPIATQYEWNRYKGRHDTWHRYTFPLPEPVLAEAVTLTLHTEGSGAMRIPEIEFGDADDRRALITRHCLARTAHPGAALLVVATDQGEVAALRPDGSLSWSRQFADEITALDAFDADSDGGDEIFIGTAAANLRCLDVAGNEAWCVAPPDGTHPERTVSYAVTLMNAPGESPKLIDGHYNGAVLRDAGSGRWLRMVPTGGAYCRMASPPARVAPDGTVAGYLFNTWGAAVKPEGAGLSHFSGLRGQPRLMQVLSRAGAPGSELIMISDEALACYGLPSCELRSQLQTFSPIGAAALLQRGTADEAVLALKDGFLLFVSLSDPCTVLHKAFIGEAANGICRLGDHLVVATFDGLLVCDLKGQVEGSVAGSWLDVTAMPGPDGPLCIAWTVDGEVRAFAP